MNWRETNCIPGIYSGLRVSPKYVMYYTSSYSLQIIYRKTLSKKLSLQFDRDYEYHISKDELLISKDNTLQVFDLNSGALRSEVQSDQDYVIPLGENTFFATSFLRTDKLFENSIFDKRGLKINHFSGPLSLHQSFSEVAILSDKSGHMLGLLDVHSGQVKWEQNLEKQLFGNVLLADKQVILGVKGGLISFDVYSGNLLWEIDTDISFFHTCENQSFIVGIAGNRFERRDVKNGKLQCSSSFSTVLSVPPHLTSCTDKSIYFSTQNEKAEPVFGAVDVISGEVVFLQELEIDGPQSLSNTPSRPNFFDGTLYLTDANKNLRIYEVGKAA